MVKEDYPKVILKASSVSDYPGIIFDYWNDREPFRAALQFGTSLTDIKLKQTNKLFYNCHHETDQEFSDYDCYAQVMSQTNATSCSKNCLSNRVNQGKGYSTVLKAETL